MRTLEEYREKIEEEADYIDIRPYSHNIVGLLLSSIAAHYGDDEAKKAIKDFHLEEKGWSLD